MARTPNTQDRGDEVKVTRRANMGDKRGGKRPKKKKNRISPGAYAFLRTKSCNNKDGHAVTTRYMYTHKVMTSTSYMHCESNKIFLDLFKLFSFLQIKPPGILSEEYSAVSFKKSHQAFFSTVFIFFTIYQAMLCFSSFTDKVILASLLQLKFSHNKVKKCP